MNWRATSAAIRRWRATGSRCCRAWRPAGARCRAHVLLRAADSSASPADSITVSICRGKQAMGAPRRSRVARRSARCSGRACTRARTQSWLGVQGEWSVRRPPACPWSAAEGQHINGWVADMTHGCGEGMGPCRFAPGHKDGVVAVHGPEGHENCRGALIARAHLVRQEGFLAAHSHCPHGMRKLVLQRVIWLLQHGLHEEPTVKMQQACSRAVSARAHRTTAVRTGLLQNDAPKTLHAGDSRAPEFLVHGTLGGRPAQRRGGVVVAQLLVERHYARVGSVFGSEGLVCDGVEEICKVLFPPEPCRVDEH